MSQRLPSDRATRYARDVVAGHEIAGPLVRLAAARHLRNVRDWGARRRPAHTFWWSQAHAERVIAFFEQELVLPDVLDETTGECQPFLLSPFQAFQVGSLFGWMRTNGHRRFRTAYLELAKGAGKSPQGAGIGLYCLTADGQRYPEVYSAAVSQKQAVIVWTDAKRMVEHAPRLKQHIEVTAHTLIARGHVGGGKFEAVSSEYRSLQGKRPHCAIVDELHEHPNGQVVTQLRRGTKRNQDALIVELTNSGYDRTSICYQHHEYSQRVLEQVVDNETWFAYVCGLDDADDYRDEGVWRKANPNLGVTIDVAYLREAVAEAEGMPASEADVRRLNFCEWVERQSNFIPAAVWQDGARVQPPAGIEGIAPYGGLDLGMTDDMCAFALTWRLAADQYYARTWYWAPEGAIKKHPQRPWSAWLKAGALTVTEGDVTDFVRVRAEVSQLTREYGCHVVAFDRRFAAQMAQELMGEGLTMIDQMQGFALNEPTRALGSLLQAGGYSHDGNPVDAWQASNLVVTRGTRGDVRPDKDKSGDKIDGMVARIMSLSRALLHVEADEGPSTYETHGILALDEL